MDILKTATDWAKAEVFSTAIFILAGIVFVTICISFWQFGKTDLAKAYIIPTLVAGILLLSLGLGLMFTNISRISAFESHYKEDVTAFIASEANRVDSTLNEYKVVFRVVPLLVVLAGFMLVFLTTPTWRAIGVTTIAMLMFIAFIDGLAYARMEVYKEKIVYAEKGIDKANN